MKQFNIYAIKVKSVEQSSEGNHPSANKKIPKIVAK